MQISDVYINLVNIDSEIRLARTDAGELSCVQTCGASRVEYHEQRAHGDP